MMPLREMRRLSRAVLLAAHIAFGIILALLVLLLPPLRRRVNRLAAWWLRRASAILGLRVLMHGRPAAGPALFVANHISWVDILVLAHCSEAAFVAKAEISDWPVLGWLASVGGTEFIRRGNLESYRGVHGRLTRRLKAGEALTVFPEGTSGHQVKPARFRPRMLQAAVDAGVPVQPVGLYYGAALGLLRRVAFVGDDSFVTHLWRLLQEEPVLAEVSFLPALSTVSGDVRLLADEAWRAVTHALTRLELFERESSLVHAESEYNAELLRAV
ncbi:MAG: lysophospholipid acyltransferase family protein [Bacillota bacterium]